MAVQEKEIDNGLKSLTELYSDGLKGILEELTEKQEEFISHISTTPNIVEFKITISIRGGEVPTYKVETEHFPKILFDTRK